jgi:SAM-dependent methyltransferase
MKSEAFMPINSGISYRHKRGMPKFFDLSLFNLINKKPEIARLIFEVYASERVVEYPFVHQNLNLTAGEKILDVGSCFSDLPIELASLGYKVWAEDQLDYPLIHSNLTFLKGDLLTMPLPEKFFDAVTAVSTIEHIGLGRWKDKISNDGDRKAVQRLFTSLKDQGKFIFTVPFGESGIWNYRNIPLGRVYNIEDIKLLTLGFKIIKIQFAIKNNHEWLLTNYDQVKDVSRQEGSLEERAVVMVACEKENKQT